MSNTTEPARTLNIAMAAAAICFAFTWLPINDLYEAASVALILLFILLLASPSGRVLWSDPLVKLSVLFCAFLSVSILWHLWSLPETFPNTTSERRLLRVFYFLPIAYGVTRGNLVSPWTLLIIAGLGLITYLGLTFEAQEWQEAWHGTRVDFGIQNAQHTGIIFASAALLLCFFAYRLFLWARPRSWWGKSTAGTLWLAASLFAFWGVLVTEVRAVWLGLSLALCSLPVFFLAAAAIKGKALMSLRSTLISAAAVLIILGAGVIAFDVKERVESRLGGENVTLKSLSIAAQHKETELTSVGVRISSWAASIEWIGQRPLLGWGGKGAKRLIQEYPYFSSEFKRNFDHLHNSYLQVLVEIGIVGSLFMVSMMVLFALATIRSLRQGTMPLDVFLFAWTFAVFWLVVNCFESYIIYQSGKYINALIGGFIYMFCLPKSRSTLIAKH